MLYFELRILASCPSSQLVSSGRDFLIALDARLRENSNGSCLGLVTESDITAEIVCANRDEPVPAIEAFVEKHFQSGITLRAVLNDRVSHPLTTEQRDLAASLNPTPAKLTLKHFKALATGSFLVSNVFITPEQPIFAEIVAPLESRSEQWQQIRAAGAAQYLCHVFRTEEEFRRGWLQPRLDMALTPSPPPYRITRSV
jgi:hypothetical protein